MDLRNVTSALRDWRLGTITDNDALLEALGKLPPLPKPTPAQEQEMICLAIEYAPMFAAMMGMTIPPITPPAYCTTATKPDTATRIAIAKAVLDSFVD